MAFLYAFPYVVGVITGKVGTSIKSDGYVISIADGNVGNGNVLFFNINSLPFPFPWEQPFLKCRERFLVKQWSKQRKNFPLLLLDQ